MDKDAQSELDLEREAFARQTAESTQVQMNALDVIRALQLDGRFFINFFLADELKFPVPKFHLDSWDLLTHPGVEQVALALPRGHAKTTLAKLAVVWHYLFTPTRFTIYVSNTGSVASESCQDIANFIRSSNFAAVFGEPEFTVNQDQRGFYKFWITLPHVLDAAGQPTRKQCILKSFGAGMQVRGMNIDNERPELAVCDDVEDDDNTATKPLIQRLRVWFYGAFLKALARSNRKIIFLGNMLSTQSLLYHFTERSDLWYTMRFGCLLSNGEPLWPDLWPIEAIRADFKEYQQLGLIGRWFAEMMNIAMPDSSPLVNSDELVYAPEMTPEEAEYSFITLDPAISQKTWADNSAIVVHAYRRGTWQVVEYVVGKYDPSDLFGIICALGIKWHTRVVGIEAATFQRALKVLFEVYMHMQQHSLTIVEVSHGNQRKVDRLAVWVSFIRRGVYSLNEGDYAITEQLLKFDPGRKDNDDDLVDACAMGPTMIDNFMSTIIDDYDPDPARYELSTTLNVTGA